MASAPRLTFRSVDTFEYLATIGAVIVLVLLAGVVIMAIRRRLLRTDQSATDAGLFESLRAMRDRGEISREEYDRAKRSMVEKLAARKPPPPERE